MGFLALLAACSAGSGDSPAPCSPGTTAAFDTCVTVLDACADPNSVPRAGGGCTTVGVDACGEGFVADEGGCRAILPTAPCASGEVALPGDTSCHPLDECPSDRFGAKVEGALHVDATAVVPFDGTEAHPFATLTDALAAATKGQTIRVADGEYASGARVDRGIVVRGRCTSRVRIVAPDGGFGMILTDGATLGSITLRGGGLGVIAQEDVTLDTVVIQKADAGMVATASRDARVVVRRVLVEDTKGAGVDLSGSNAAVTDLVIRRAGDAGLRISRTKEGRSTQLSLVRALLEDIGDVGLYVNNSAVKVERLVVRLTGAEGVGFSGGIDPAATLTLKQSVLTSSGADGVRALRGPVALDRVTVRDVGVKGGIASGVWGLFGATLTIERSLIRGATYAGVLGQGSSVTVRDSIVRDGVGVGDQAGYGVVVRIEDAAHPAPTLLLERSVVRRARAAGVLAFGARATVVGCRIEDTLALPDGLFGDGVQVSAFFEAGRVLDASLSVSSTYLAGNARAALVSFGGTLELASSRVCAPGVGIDVEAFAVDAFGIKRPGPAATLVDHGASACGCGALEPCIAVTASLAALRPPPPPK